MKKQKVSFDKLPITISEQLNLLQNRGMIIDNIDEATHNLTHINYYRLSAYWLPYELLNSHNFKENTNFQEILNHYKFDRELRLHILKAIERIEISLRSNMAHILSLKYGTHPHLQKDIFSNNDKYNNTLQKLKSEINRSNELFIKHFNNSYKEELPPLWASVELMTIGQISNWYSNLKHRKDRNDISKIYGLNETILKSFMHHLTIIRNISAHHSRLWNRRFMFTFKLPNNPAELSSKINHNNTNSIFNTIIMIEYFMNIIDKDTSWYKELNELIVSYDINKDSMGFPVDK
jgi:abortive infection bacteriophage resistance protein